MSQSRNLSMAATADISALECSSPLDKSFTSCASGLTVTSDEDVTSSGSTVSNSSSRRHGAASVLLLASPALSDADDER